MLKSLKAIIWVTSRVLYYDVTLNETLISREGIKLQLYVGKENCRFVLLTKMNKQLFY